MLFSKPGKIDPCFLLPEDDMFQLGLSLTQGIEYVD